MQSLNLLSEARFTDEIPFRDEFPAWQRAGVRVYQVLERPAHAHAPGHLG